MADLDLASESPFFEVLRLRDECGADTYLASDTAAKALHAGARRVLIMVQEDGDVLIQGWRK